MFSDLQDGIIFLNRYTDKDITAHIAGEDEETARRFGPALALQALAPAPELRSPARWP